MIFTVLYMYATVLQWWRLGTLRNKLNGTLNAHNALLVCDDSIIYDTRKVRSFENLLFRRDERIGCTVVPRQKINLSQWVSFPKDYRYFPIYFTSTRDKVDSPNIYVLLQAMLGTYEKHSAANLQVENFGELVAWKVTDYFEAILKTDIDKLTKLVHCYSQSPVDINHDLKLLKIETVEVEGAAAKLRYEQKFSKESVLKYSYAPVHWKKFVDSLKDIYSRIRDSTNPKIMIENGAAKPEDVKKVPVNEVKPIKKDGKKSEDKNTLEVGCSGYRRHKIAAKSEKGIEQKHKEHKFDGKKDDKEKHRKKEEETKKDALKSQKEYTESKKVLQHKKEQRKERDPSKLERAKSKADLEVSGKSSGAQKSKNVNKRSTSSEKKLVKSAAVCDDADVDKSKEKLKNGGPENGHHASCNLFMKYKGVKPPNILVYADSVVAKQNVKAVLSTMLNKEKYTVYDLPMTPNKAVWNGSTILVIVCGNVPPSLTFHLLQYLLSGGQLLCLCSDLLYSVLHTFTTAEVREHELVRFTYGKWRQVKMMHHIFCYQASPAKKQFSKDSDHSNQSSGNGSSPIAPRTPSAVEIQHNGKDYTIQVQVLGTEETWQTPSLLLATVKDCEGRAIFSQVHLEIDPNEYEDDESKFTALKDSDQARMEILRDILSNHLDIDCSQGAEVVYTPAYFLGRHDLKLKLLSDCEHIKENTLVNDKITLKFCGVDEKAVTPSSSFVPVFIHACPSNFSTVNYFEALETQHVGRLVLYCDVLTSSQLVLSKPLSHGLVVIPRQQTQGIGRSSNVWISPKGSANFSLQLHIDKNLELYKRLPLTQQIVMVGVVHALKKFNGCQELKVGIKWPNDLYANGSVKIGGLVANTFLSDDVAVVNIGCGINLDNSNPTTCVNDLIRAANVDSTVSYETYFASVFNETEKLLDRYQAGDSDYFFDLYYRYWLHKDSEVTITSKEGNKERAKVAGIDDFGFLKVRSQDGKIISVQPDGNTFDMMEGLISPKAF